MDGKGGLADLLSEATAHLAEASSAQFLRPVCTQVSEQTACKSHYWYYSVEISSGDNKVIDI